MVHVSSSSAAHGVVTPPSSSKPPPRTVTHEPPRDGPPSGSMDEIVCGAAYRNIIGAAPVAMPRASA